jgi:cyanate lyase
VTREQLTQQILESKRSKRLSFAAIADALELDRVWTTAALLGQHPFDAESADKLVELLELPGDADASAVLQEVPMRGSFEQLPPTDPTIYRFYEVLQVYGPAIKALIHEDFGDGIMSAINFNMAIDRVEHADGDRVRVTLEGKFLPYNW